MDTLLGQYLNELDVPVADDTLDLLMRFVSLIVKWNRFRNLLATDTSRAAIVRHVVDCLAAVPYVEGAAIADIGSGAGLPGVVVACVRRHSHVYLIESRGRKSRFLTQAQVELGLGNVTVVPARVETWRPPAPLSAICCRAYGSLRQFYLDTAHLHHGACKLVALKGAPPSQELRDLELAAAADIVELTVPGMEHRHVVVIDCAKVAHAAAGKPGGNAP